MLSATMKRMPKRSGLVIVFAVGYQNLYAGETIPGDAEPLLSTMRSITEYSRGIAPCGRFDAFYETSRSGAAARVAAAAKAAAASGYPSEDKDGNKICRSWGGVSLNRCSYNWLNWAPYSPALLTDWSHVIFKDDTACYVNNWDFNFPSDENVQSSITAYREAICPPGFEWDVPNLVARCLKAKSPRKRKNFGNSCSDAGNPINVAVGNKHQEEFDVQGGSVASLSFSRFFNSAYSGSKAPILDNGWTSNFDSRLTSFNDDAYVRIERPDGREFIFRKAAGGYIAEPDVNDRLVRNADGAEDGAMWTYYEASGAVERFHEVGFLLSRTQLGGYSYRLTTSQAPDGSGAVPYSVVDSFGNMLRFEYGAGARLARVFLNEALVVSFSFDTSTSTATYADGARRGYNYQSVAGLRALTSITDEDGIVQGTYRYDTTTGAAISTETQPGVGGHYIAYSSDGTKSTVVDPLGASTELTLQTIHDVVKVTGRSQPAGSGCNASSSSIAYDDNGNISRSDDFTGVRSCFAYDTSRNLEVARVAGVASGTECSAILAAGAALPVGGVKISKQWHPEWRLETARAEPGRITVSIYNGQPDPLNGGAVALCAPADAKLPDGKPTVVLCKQVEQATSDANGSQGFSASIRAEVPRRQRSWTYNQFGQVLSETDPLGQVTRYDYYDASSAVAMKGDLKSITNARGHITTFDEYNHAGRLIQSTDPNGVVTRNDYDLRQRLLSSSVGGEVSSYAYSLAGRLLSTTLPNGAVLTYTYDPANRLKQVTDSAGNKVVYTLDAAGRRTGEQVQDASGVLARNITRSFDALGRLQQVTGATQ